MQRDINTLIEDIVNEEIINAKKNIQMVPTILSNHFLIVCNVSIYFPSPSYCLLYF